MAFLGRNSSIQIRPYNKEPDWSSVCNNVFEQYLDDNDPFGLGSEKQRGRSSSDNSDHLFDLSRSSEQSHQTDGTSPKPSWGFSDGTIPIARQPKARAPTDFWHKKLRALEQNAADCEIRQQKLRAAKSHPDFLSLGGFPSPPAVPGPPTDQSYLTQGRKSHTAGTAANGKKNLSQHRSIGNLRAASRGRSTGVTKPPATAAAIPSAAVRKRNVSPSKMMTPSRYRAGFKDVWAERVIASPKKFELRLTASPFPASPPPSARAEQDAFAAFGSPCYAAIPGYDDQISPLTSSFRQAARIHTPVTTPLLSPGSRAAASYFEAPASFVANPYTTQTTVPLNDTAPLFPPENSSLAVNKVDEFDFGFSSSPEPHNPWDTTSFSPEESFSTNNPFGSLEKNLGMNAHSKNQNLGLGISCEPKMLHNNYTTMPDTSFLSDMTYQPALPSENPLYSLPHGLPSPTRRQRDLLTRSPSPPAPGARSWRASGSRRSSRSRRNKSATPSPRKAEESSFVNYTPQDHNKILSGVAPSGSSKTKARREREAAEKRRKLSQAAMQAVIEAGGDVEALQKAGVIIGFASPM